MIWGINFVNSCISDIMVLSYKCLDFATKIVSIFIANYIKCSSWRHARKWEKGLMILWPQQKSLKTIESREGCAKNFNFR